MENHEPATIIIVSGVAVPCRRVLPPLLLNHRHYEEQNTQIGERTGSLVGAPSLPLSLWVVLPSFCRQDPLLLYRCVSGHRKSTIGAFGSRHH
ncbi:uncharacterized protein DS421_13g417910 [Arachis hypogaea]|nr:uncharacterized protein DS421_13g417910 [Arachis hypogaea]